MSLGNIEEDPSLEKPDYHRLNVSQLKALDDAESSFETRSKNGSKDDGLFFLSS
jgi:hypothetical protein